MSLLECMSFGVVPISTDVGSIKTVLNQDNGIFIKKKNVQSIVDAIILLNHDRDLLERMSISAKRTIFDMLSPEVYIKKLNRIYEKL